MEWEGFVFQIDDMDKSAMLTKYTGDKTEVVIPSHIRKNDETFIVKYVGGHKVYVNHNDGYHGREFVGNYLRHFRIVGAFWESKLTDVTVPECVTIVERLAFPSGTTIHGKCGSSAEKYAMEYGYRFEPI